MSPGRRDRLCVDATGNFLGFSTSGTVSNIGNTLTGPSVGPNGISVLGGLRAGGVFALSFSNQLFSVNSSSGALTLLGLLPLPTQESEYNGSMTTSLNGDGQFLYYTIEISGGPNAIGPTLYRVNPVTLQITTRTLTGLPARLIGSGFVDGLFYGFTDEGHILRIDHLTGVASAFGTYDAGVPPGGGPPFAGVFGVVDTPEASAIWLTAAGLAVAAFARRRRAA